MRLTKVLAPALVVLTLVTVFSNFRIAFREIPFGITQTSYEVEDILTSAKWVSSAPIFLAQNFEQVKVTNVGDQTKNGFGFSAQILEIWKAGTTDASQDPIDLRANVSTYKLIALSKVNTKTYCIQRQRTFCRMDVIWDDTADKTYAEFVGVRTGERTYALVEAKLLERFIAGGL